MIQSRKEKREVIDAFRALRSLGRVCRPAQCGHLAFEL